MKRQLLSKAMLLLCALIVGVSSAWGTEAVYKTALFGSSYNSKEVQDYTSTWTATNSDFTVSLTNFNNNKNGWDYVKCGRKNTASTGTITTSAAIDKPITKVTVAIDAITATNATSITLYTSTNNSTWTSAGTFTKAKGAQTVTLSSPAANLYYKIEFVCSSASSNGVVQVSKIDYYYNAKSSPSLSVSPTSLDLAWGDTESFTVSKTGDGELSVTSNDTGVATVAQDGTDPSKYNVSYVGDGSTTITVSVAETATYSGDTKTVSITALDIRDAAGISFASATANALVAAGTYKQTLTNPNNLSVTYGSSDESVATVASDGTVTLKKAGTTTITATFAGNEDYKPATVSYTLTITAKKVATLIFTDDAVTKLTTDAAFTNNVLTEPDDITLVYSSSDTDVATVDAASGEVTIKGAGTATIKATVNDDAYEATEFTYTLTVNKADAPISFSTATAETALDETESFVAPTLNNPQSLTIAWSSSDTDVATINESTGVITFKAVGETTITATSAENATYKSGAVSYTLTVSKAAETLPFSHTFISGSGLGDFTASASDIWTAHNTYGAVATGKTDGNWLYSPIINLKDETSATLTFSHATNGVTTPLDDNATLWIREVGGSWNKLTLTYSNNSSWTYVNQTISLNSYCGKKVQLGFKYISSNNTGKWEIKNFSIADIREEAPISFSDATVYKLLKDKDTYTGQVLTNDEDLTVSYSSSNTDVAIVNASTGVVTIKAVGETDITATFAGNSSFKANTATYKLVVTNKAAAGIEYAESAVTKKITLGTYTHTLTNPNSLTVAYSSSDETVATVHASTGEVTMKKAGETTITATFTENDDYDGAAASYTLTVIKDTPTLSFASSSVNGSLAEGTYKQALTNPADLTVTYESSDETVGTVAADGTVTMLKAGSTTITANFAGNELYESGSASYTLTVKVDYATLPFAFDNGSSSIASTTGLTQSGLGDDYKSSPYLKFDNTGDYVILKIGEAPGTLTFDIKGNSFSGGTFKVQTSADGSNYTDLASYTRLNDTQSEEFDDLALNVRYIKWIYTNKSSGNVALGNIKLGKAPVTIPVTAVGWATYCSDKALDFTDITTITAYTAEKDGDAVKFTKVTGKVPANTGLLVSGVTTSVPVATGDVPAVGTNLLEGVLVNTEMAAGAVFVLMNGDKGLGFYKNTNAFTVRANSAYLLASDVTGARTFVGFDGDTDPVVTGISAVHGEEGMALGDVFDLQGRKVSQPQKGLYIVNGKKVVIK